MVYKGFVRGLGNFYANGDERVEIHIPKTKATSFPHENGNRIGVELKFNTGMYLGGVRATTKNSYIWICPDLIELEGKKVNLSSVIKENGFIKNEKISLNIVSTKNIMIEVAKQKQIP